MIWLVLVFQGCIVVEDLVVKPTGPSSTHQFPLSALLAYIVIELLNLEERTKAIPPTS